MGLFGVLFLLLSILVLCMVSRGGWGGFERLRVDVEGKQ